MRQLFVSESGARAERNASEAQSRAKAVGSPVHGSRPLLVSLSLTLSSSSRVSFLPVSFHEGCRHEFVAGALLIGVAALLCAGLGRPTPAPIRTGDTRVGVGTAHLVFLV